MALPVKVRAAFRLGHPLAAHVRCSDPMGKAWVWVAPIMRGGKRYQKVLEQWTRKREAGEPYDDTILKYKVRYLELSSWNTEQDYTHALDFVERERAVRDEKTEVDDEPALEEWLRQFLGDFTMLGAPSSVDYYFACY